MPIYQLTDHKQDALYDHSATNTGTIVDVAGAHVRAHPWSVGGHSIFHGTSPACWNWTLMGGDSTAETDDPSHGYESVRGEQRPPAGCWAAGVGASTAVITQPSIRLPAGYRWDGEGVHVPNVQGVPAVVTEDEYRTWFKLVVEAVSEREATYHGYTVHSADWVTLNAFHPVPNGYYVCMFPEFGLQPNQAPALANHRLYKPPMYDHWWLQVPAGHNRYVSLDTVPGNDLRIFRDSHIWANRPYEVLVMTVNGMLTSHEAKLETMGLLT